MEEILFRFFHRVGFVFLYDLPGNMRLLDDGVLAFDKQADLVLVNLRGRVVLSVSSLAFCKESVNKVSNADMVCCTSDMDCTYLR